MFLRYLTGANSPETERMQAVASSLFEAIERGDVEATTSEVVLHEVCYVLGSNKLYHFSSSDIAEYLLPILRMDGLKFVRGDKRLYQRALELSGSNPKLGFADAIVAARCIANEHELATFDELLARLPDIVRWNP